MKLLYVCLALRVVSALRASSRSDPLATPDLRQYDPVEVLCTQGRDADGNGNIKGWCKDWLACIEAGAQPKGDAAAVRAAWKPAACEEYCGEWPVTTPAEGSQPSSSNATKLLQHRSTGASNSSDCMQSCENFQNSLTSCVATILFEPGKVAAMGIPSNKPEPKAPAICTATKTSCMPDLAVRYQKCISSAGKLSECKKLKVEVEECKDCPTQQQNFQSHYHSFVGGCMDQLHAYWAATHPRHGAAVAIPGATGCKVH